MKKVLPLLTLLFSFTLSNAQTVSPTCPGAEPVCSSNGSNFGLSTSGTYGIDGGSSVSNPSSGPTQSYSGNTLPCLLTNGPNPNWFIIYIGTSGMLQFTIGSPGGPSSCFDWALWQVNSTDPTSTCPGITTNNNVPPAACGWNGACSGYTGMWSGALPSNANPADFSQSIPVVAGESYMLCFSNYSYLSGNAQLSFPSGPGVADVTCTPNTPDQTICQGTSATVNITATGGPVTGVNWVTTTGVSNTSGITGVIVTPPATTDYIVQINQGGQISQDTFTIFIVPPPAPNAGADQMVCSGTSFQLNGTVASNSNTHTWQSIVPPGMTPPANASFSPNTSSLNPTVTVNQPGTYKFVLRESNTTCGTVRDTVVVFVQQMTLTATSTPPSCGGYSDGTITITSALATQYSFDNGATWQSSNTAAGFAAGPHQVCAKSASGCQACITTTIVDPPGVTISTSNDTTVCQNGTASLMASATGGASYTYTWENSSVTGSSNPVILPSTQYITVFATNELGCNSPLDSILVTLLPPISAEMTPDFSVCPGYPGSLTATGSGGIGAPYQYVWGNGQTDSGAQSMMTDSPMATTNYTVTVTDGCESTPLTINGNLVAYPVPVPSFMTPDAVICEPALFTIVSTTDPSTVAASEWRTSDGEIFTNADTILPVALYHGQYDVTYIVVSPDGCIDSITEYAFLTVNAVPVADFNWSPNPPTVFNTEVTFHNLSTSTATNLNWLMPGGTPASSTIDEPTTTYPEGIPGTYYVTLVATDPEGCFDSITKPVVVQPEVLIYAPNAFTPDGDEFNQTWRVYMEGVDKYNFNLLVFDRWGEIVWESNDIEAEWDGTYHGKIVKEGAYQWVIRVKDALNDSKYTYNGSIVIIR